MSTCLTDDQLAKWLTRIEQLHPHTIALGLERIEPVAIALGLSDLLHTSPKRPTVITVTGTNGKGSCVACLSSIYHHAGYRVGSYTSPHLWQFTERIRINNSEIDPNTLCEAFAAVDAARGDISLTYFEFTTLAALYTFQNAGLDILVLEVGMGGRLDAVNIVDADVAVITSVDLDHQAWLGETREQIAKEKAGIMRNGHPVVCGRDMPANIAEIAAELSCPLYRYEQEFSLSCAEQKKYYHEALLIDNIALSLKVVELLQHQHPVSEVDKEEGIRRCQLPGRQQVVQTPVWQLFDVAHNPHAVTRLAKRLQDEEKKHTTLAVFAMLCDKDVKSCVKIIAPLISEWYVAGLTGERGMSTPQTAEIVEEVVDVPVHRFLTVPDAHQAACKAAQSANYRANCRIVIFGSFHTVAEALVK